ncbi:MAG: phage major capsid protein [Actinomycetaceae bacterium]|nr:phage major capsid protein [Finegoldia magna]MDD7465540.1 phage major capsid protein [Actinomycetaceae bacterium]
MTTMNDLREKRAKTWEKAKAFLDTHQGDDGRLSAEDDATYAAMMDDMDALASAISRMEKAEAIDAEMARATSKPLTVMPGVNTPNTDEKPGRASAEYRRAFWDAMRMNANPYEIRNALSEGVDTEGGYLVPDEFETQVVAALEEENFVRGLAKVIQTSSGDRKIPVVATHGIATWLEEGKAYSESDEVFDQMTLGSYKLGTFLKISEELLNDSAFDIESYLSGEFGRRIGAAEEEAFLTGDGTNKPTGIFATAEEGLKASAATTVTADELIDLHYSLRSPYRKNAVWVMNDSTVKVIRKLKDNNGQYLWQPALTAGTPDTILNRPVYTSQFAPELKGGARGIAFGDLSFYWIADRQGRAFKRLNELFATTGQVAFLASQRVDGKLIIPEAVKVITQKTAPGA